MIVVVWCYYSEFKENYPSKMLWAGMYQHKNFGNTDKLIIIENLANVGWYH